MCLDKEAVTSGSHRGTRQDRGQIAVTPGRFPCATRALDRMGGIENDLTIQALHPINGSHVGDKVIIAECRPPFREEERLAAGGFEFFCHIGHVPGSQKLAFLHVDHPAGRPGRNDQVRLPAEKSGDLEHIDGLAGDLRLLGRVDVGRHGDSQFPPDLSQQEAAIPHPGAPERPERSPVGLVIRRLENEGRPLAIANGLQLFRHPAGKCRRFDHARPQNEQQLPAPEFVGTYFDNRSSRHLLHTIRTSPDSASLRSSEWV